MARARLLSVAVLSASVVALACNERTVAPDDRLAPNLDKGGIPGWRDCFDGDAAPVLFGTPWPLTPPRCRRA